MSSSSVIAGLVGGLVGAVLGGVGMLALRPAQVAPPQPQSADLRAAFADALAPLLEELRTGGDAVRKPTRPRIRRDDGDAASGTDVDPSAATPLPGGTRELPVAEGSGPDTPLRPDSSTWTPPPNFERVRSVRDFDEDIRVRQRWLFLSEQQALAEFGTPTGTWLSENGESWVYDEPDVETEDEIVHGNTTTLVFSRGRLVQVYD